MKSLNIVLSVIFLGLCVFVLSGCSAGSGYSSVGVSYGNYWGPYSSYRPSYNYDYRRSSEYRNRNRDRSAIGRPLTSVESGQRRSRPQGQATRSRPSRRR